MTEIPVGPRIPHSRHETQNWGQPGSGGIPLLVEVLGVERYNGAHIFFLTPWSPFGTLIYDGITGQEKVIAIPRTRVAMTQPWHSDDFTTASYIAYRRRNR